ncbi:MAG: T9SS type A sorting domain-containing protein [candidate division Zixibacteria bacterium]|nr:T9SS type A sorting domain-containing protein [candidate division Zixibacteria bacterium]
MTKTVRVFLSVFLIFSVFLVVTPAEVTAYQMGRQVLDAGGNMWATTGSFKLCSSLGQSICGTQSAPTREVYTGFWNPWVVMTYPLDVTTETEVPLPRDFALSQNYPNPFNPTTVIRYALPRRSQVRICIYNILGQSVRNLVDTEQSAGFKLIHWDGCDDFGNEVGSGVYFYRMETEDFVKSRKMVLLK